MPERIPSPTWADPAESLETVWAALERLPDDALTDDERDDLNTAMAWIAEGLEIDPSDTIVSEKGTQE